MTSPLQDCAFFAVLFAISAAQYALAAMYAVSWFDQPLHLV